MSGLIEKVLSGFEHDYQRTLFESIGGMGRIAKASDRNVGGVLSSMPGFAGFLSDKQIAKVLNCVRGDR